MDFRKLYEVGSRINEPFEQLVYGKGYDHTYILNKKRSCEFSFCAECVSPKTGIRDGRLYDRARCTALYSQLDDREFYREKWETVSDESCYLS